MMIFFQTFGCSTNQSESEVMKGLLQEKDFTITDDIDDAKIIIVNICTVKGENNAIREIRKLFESYPKKRFIIAGCISKEIIPMIKGINPDASLLSTHNIDQIVDVVEEVMNDNVIESLVRDYRKKVNLPKIRKNPIIGIIPILNSCAGNCSYCSVKLIKGHLFSYPKEDIIKEAKDCIKDNCKELWVTSQDNAAYMLEKTDVTRLPELLRDICNLDGDFFVRLGMMNPEHVIPVVDLLIDVFKNPKLFKFLHLPVQSGNDRILKAMNRKYSVDDFLSLIHEFRKKIPSLTLSTDIICGFPTETEQEFSDSIDIVRETQPDVLNISRYQLRPRTKAASLGELPSWHVKERSRIMTDIYHNIARISNEKWLNWSGDILIDEQGKEGTSVGRNFAYKPVVVEGEHKLGTKLKVEISDSTTFYLKANLKN